MTELQIGAPPETSWSVSIEQRVDRYFDEQNTSRITPVGEPVVTIHLCDGKTGKQYTFVGRGTITIH